MTFSNEQIETLKKLGNEWKKGEFHRIYINNLETRLGLDVSYYKTGNVSGATLDGERISNSQAKKILGRLAGTKLYFDVKSGFLVCQYGRLADEERRKIISSIEAEIEEE